jgi:phage gp29-like protein
MSAFDRGVRYGSDNEIWVRQGMLSDRWVETPNALLEQARQYYGRALNPETIERVIAMADCGFLRDLTDLQYEASRIDPTWSMCDKKRLRAVSTIKSKVVPATGDGIDPKIAAQYADVVRQQIAWIPNFRQVAIRLNWAHKHGRAAAEKVWRENPGGSDVKWRIDRINWIHPRRLALGPDRELRVRDDAWTGLGFERRGLALRDYPYKFIGFLPQQYDEYPEREGYGPRALYFSFFKRFGTRERLILMEVFGRPWRIIEAHEGAAPQKESLDEAARNIDAAAANATGVAPPGTKIVLAQPAQGAGQVHRDVIQDCNDEIAKLILGEVRTSDAKPGAIGSQGEEVALTLQSEVKIEDALDCSDLLTEQFAVDVIALNFGTDKLDHCPAIELYYEQPTNRTEEIDRTEKAFSMGLPLKADEVYERIGFTKPAAGDEIIQQQGGQSSGPLGQTTPTVTEGRMPSEDELDATGLEVPGSGGDDGSPLGEGGEGGKEQDDMTQLRARPLDEMTLVRAAHVLELVNLIGSPGRRVVRRRLPKPKTEE